MNICLLFHIIILSYIKMSEDINTETAKTYEYKLNDKQIMEIYNNDSISIFNNDLKYKKYNNIDITRVKNFTDKQDRDTIEYRIQDINNNSLDLSHLNLTKLPDLSIEIKNKIQYLFLSENNIEIIDNMTEFTELLVLDLCNNKLINLPNMPEKLEELLIKNNHISNIDTLSNLYYLKRLECSDNIISHIPLLNNIEILYCDNNLIIELPNLPKIIKLSCQNNKIKCLNNMPNLELFECTKNCIQFIKNYNNLKELYINKNDLVSISNINKIKVLHCKNTKLNKLEYFETLKELICDYRQDFLLSKHYTILYSDVYKNNINIIYFK